MEKLRLPEDAIKRGWLGEMLGLFEQGGGLFTQRERRVAVFRDLGRRLERDCFGEWKGGRLLSGFNA